jgi:hypothetical protein
MTTKQKKVTKAQATSVLKQVCDHYGIKPDSRNAPKLIMDFDWLGHGGQPHIVWEEGPYDWALRHWEAQSADVFLEPMTSWALGIFPAF